ncbi:MAG: hypothetical protein AB8G22_08760, partial [Saprospiraceae bacterium]
WSNWKRLNWGKEERFDTHFARINVFFVHCLPGSERIKATQMKYLQRREDVGGKYRTKSFLKMRFIQTFFLFHDYAIG